MLQNSIVWAFVAIIGLVVLSEVLQDPKVKGMRECARGATGEETIECARVIFGTEE